MADNRKVNPSRIAPFILALTLTALCSDKGFNPPPAAAARTYPAHEAHDDEKVAIAVDPFDTAEKAEVFKVKYREYGFLPVRLIISNDGDKPLMLDDMKIEFVTAGKDKLRPAVRDDIFRRLVRPEKAAGGPTVHFPIPVPHNHKPISKEARDEIDLALFRTVPVTPQSTNSGFVFFDVLGIENPEDHAHIYISGIKSGTQELFYFDIPLDDYLKRPAAR
ncbi:MAG TPA: hypothetical protein VLT16_17630 [Candidatus Limnocylindrales bacterium]|nr:hypothetical protein [Candidatus Limnocylindrales bacterium]